VGLALKTENFQEIRFSLVKAMDWLRENSENLESPRHLSLAITGLIVGGDPHKAHHIQRLVSKLRNKQNTENNFKNGSWSGEVYDTAYSLIAVNKAKLHTEKARQIDYLEKGLIFLEQNYDQKLKNWSDYLPETIACCKAILELRDNNQWDNLKNSLQWLSTRKCSNDNSFVSTKYTAEIVSLLRLAATEMATDDFDDSIEFGINHIRDASHSDSWSKDPWALSKAILAILQVDKLAKIKDELVTESIGDLMGQQSANGSWDDSIGKTVSCIMVMAEMLGYKVINELKIHYWANCKPTPVAFNWDYTPQTLENPKEGRALGQIIKSQNIGAPQTLVRFPNNISLETVDDMVNDRLRAVSTAADNVRKRGPRNPQIAGANPYSKNYVLDTLRKVGDSLYTLMLLHGENGKKYEVELSKNKVDHITISAEGALSTIPWELIWDGHDFCCMKYSVGRSMGQTGFYDNGIQNNKIKVLLVGDPSGDLKEAGNEIQAIKNSFDNNWAEVESITEENFDIRNGKFSRKFLDLLRNGKFDIIHFAGHADFIGGKSYLIFQNPDENRVDKVSAEEVLNQIQRCDIKPKIVFFNACSSAARDHLRDAKELQFDRNFASLATDFVKGFSNIHVPAYIGAMWPIHDTEAAEFAITFYQSIKKGCTIGDSIRLARIESYLNRPEHLTWASFILYGDPNTKLSILEEKIER